MGQGAEDANAAYDMLDGPGGAAEEFFGTGIGRRRGSHAAKAKDAKKGAPKCVHHRPADDGEAKATITKLDHFEWDTRKVSGRFDRNPYTLVARIKGTEHHIHLAGRFGGVLRWLDARERERAGVGA